MSELISRSELKKAIEGLVVGGAEGLKNYYENGSKSDENAWIGGVYDAWELIDNAPTVVVGYLKSCTNCDSGYAQGYSDGYLKGKEERPQGKWVFGGVCVTTDKWYCNQCHLPELEKTNFCPECGADMRGGEEE